MFNWLLRLFGAGRAEVKEVAAKVKAAAVDEVAERREAMEATAVATKAKAKAKVAVAKETVTTKVKAVKSTAIDFASMKKADLLAHAKKQKVKVAATATKAAIIAELNKVK